MIKSSYSEIYWQVCYEHRFFDWQGNTGCLVPIDAPKEHAILAICGRRYTVEVRTVTEGGKHQLLKLMLVSHRCRSKIRRSYSDGRKQRPIDWRV